MKENVKVRPVLFTSYKTSDGKYNLKVRISFNGKQKNIATDFYFTKEEFSEIRGKSNTRIYSKDKREQLKGEIFELLQDYKAVVNDLNILTLESLNKALSNNQEKYKLELFYLLNKVEKERRDAGKISSADQYKETVSSLKRVMGITDKPMVDVTPAFLYDYEKRALEYGLSPTTIGIYMRSIRFVWNYCMNNDLLDQQLYPFGRKPKYTIIQPKERKIALDTADMKVFKKAKVKGRKQFYLDMFLFSYYTFGMNLIDILKLEHGDIYNGFIDTTRKKTMKLMKLPLTEGAEDIIEKYKDEESNFLFGLLKGGETEDQLKNRSRYYTKKINSVLSDICKEKKIKKKVTTYSARHTAANNLLVQKTDIATISQLLGHKDIKTTQNYLAGLPSYDIKERVSKISM